MAEIQSRIDQFRKMAEADPNNELGHFSLGRAYLDANQDADAVKSFQRVLELNPKISKTYQLLATALLKLNHRDDAIARLKDGVRIADERGDLLPKNEMLKMLTDLGAAPPELQSQPLQPQTLSAGQLLCKRCNRVAAQLPKAPFRNDFGKAIYENTCADCWREAIGMGTKVINELRLPLADPQAQRLWEQHIREFLNL